MQAATEASHWCAFTMSQIRMFWRLAFTLHMLSFVQPAQVRAAGGVLQWNTKSEEQKALWKMLDKMCTATTVEEALVEVTAVMALEHNIWTYAYLRMLYSKNLDLYCASHRPTRATQLAAHVAKPDPLPFADALLLAAPSMLLPVAYTPTVGEACQKFGQMPFYRRGCYVCVEDRGNLKAVLQEYAECELTKGADGKYLCDCIVFSDGGRILGLGDLGAWGMVSVVGGGIVGEGGRQLIGGVRRRTGHSDRQARPLHGLRRSESLPNHSGDHRCWLFR